LREATLLYFAYTARIAPAKMAEAAPGAEFRFIAHLPEWAMTFPILGNGWDGALPTVVPAEGNTVWGAVFEVPDDEMDGLDAAEAAECRTASTVEAMDRMGRRHRVVTHVFDGNADEDHPPSAPYLELILQGCRHWELPVGWIAGLEEHLTMAG